MEHELINAFMKLMSKAGGGELVRHMIQESNETANPKVWTPAEIEKALISLQHQIDHFGRDEAIVIVETLLKKYRLRPEDFTAKYDYDDAEPQHIGVKGLQ